MLTLVEVRELVQELKRKTQTHYPNPPSSTPTGTSMKTPTRLKISSPTTKATYSDELKSYMAASSPEYTQADADLGQEVSWVKLKKRQIIVLYAYVNFK